MYSVSFDRKEICKLSLETLQVLKQTAVFWGLDWDGDRRDLSGRLADTTIRIIGLNRKELNRLSRSLEHTQICITTHPCHADLTLMIFQEFHPELSMKLESQNKVYEFEPATKSFTSVPDIVYKRFEPDICSDEVKVYWNPSSGIDITEWLTYLILQACHRESTDTLLNVEQKMYEKLLREILVPINPFLSSYQLRHYWPDMPSTGHPHGYGNEKPIDPFKNMKKSTSSQINPFKEKPSAPPSTINPFKQKEKRRH
ncbi:hypothetical protein [Alkalihalobacillus sp. TS-13]|uniref:hypothetical protein n=1 Tax=Alkalihalobacillus sp. TS-13 TaxID=2842455 RepID=UPI001C88B85D|nr:hypothetical protein [Alkalihalobacillus sp. TS-13]